ncbi:MAG: methyl-accepting chemotaxis protein, partial [Rhizobiaceae bacterium]
MAHTGFSALAQNSISKSAKWATGLSAVGGFTADVLNPLGPFAGYVALIAFAFAMFLIVAWLFKFVGADRAVPAIVFSLISCIVTGGIYSLQKSQAAENGIIAELVPAISQMQQSLGLIAAKVNKIDQTVSENLAVTRQVQETSKVVEKQTVELQKQTAEVKQQTTEIAAAIEDIAAGFKTLGNQGGIIANPERADQFYHNARVHELGGDILNARQAYLGFSKFNVDAVDAYSRFATLLKVSEGRAS